MNYSKKEWIERHIKSEGFSTWQEFCDRLLCSIYPDFIPVRAGGRNGDMKNDGYCVIDRRFFQAHSTRGKSAKATKGKIEEDYYGNVAKWDNVQEWIFIYNDPNIGEVENFIDTLRQKHIGTVQISSWHPSKIADEILKLPDDTIEYILGLPLPGNEELSDDILYKITKHVRGKRGEFDFETFENSNDGIHLLEKIKLNFEGITKDNVEAIIKTHYSDVLSVREYIEKMGKEIGPDISIIILMAQSNYKKIKEGKELTSPILEKEIFIEMAKSIIPKDKIDKSLEYMRAGLAFILYIFELCYFGKKDEFEQLNLFL